MDTAPKKLLRSTNAQDPSGKSSSRVRTLTNAGRVSKPNGNFRIDPEHTRRVLPILFGLTGFALVLYSTARYGAGVPGDGIDYLSTADNLVSSQRFIDYLGAPYLYWPPLYPLILAGIRLVSGVDTFIAGRILNAVCFGVMVWLSGFLFRRSFPDTALWAYFGLLTGLTSLPIFQLACNIASDPLFIVLVLGFALSGASYLAEPKNRTLLLLALIAGVAALLRWHGITLVASAVVLALIANWGRLKSALTHAFWVGASSSLPFFLWVYGRNYRLYGTFLGKRDLGSIDFAGNLADGLRKMVHWLLPEQVTRDSNPAILLAGMALIILVSTRWATARQLITRLGTPQHLPWVVFSIIFSGFVLLTSFTLDHPDFFDDRYYTPLYIFTFLFLALVVDEQLLKPLAAWGRERQFTGVQVLPMILILAWLIYPGYRLYKYTLTSHERGESTYNLYNSQEFHDSKVVQYLLENPLDETTPIYSNYAGAVYFYTRRITRNSPNTTQELNRKQYLLEHYPHWPSSGRAYLVWFWPNHWRHFFAPKDLGTIATLDPVYTHKDGGIYLVQQR